MAVDRTEHDRLRAEAIRSLRRVQLCLRKLSADGTDVAEARQATRTASDLVSRIRRSPVLVEGE
jgi:TPP-dependent pyruvate/acetoin dehydrogenase alpha subunit